MPQEGRILPPKLTFGELREKILFNNPKTILKWILYSSLLLEYTNISLINIITNKSKYGLEDPIYHTHKNKSNWGISKPKRHNQNW